MGKDPYYESCKMKEHHLKKVYNTLLLAELLRVNYEFFTQEYNNITGEDIFNITIKKEKYSDKEKNEIIRNAITILNIKHDYPIKEDVLEQFNKLDFN